MNELDERWAQMLGEAMQAARASGRHDVADYLDLRARNDALRQAGFRWLFEALIDIAGEAMRVMPAITIDREEPHKFDHRGANITGSLLQFRHGVRCLTVEVGWTRTPADGFMRGGALAIAKLTHFGLPKMNAELYLRVSGDHPGWFAVASEREAVTVDETFLRGHFDTFLGN